MNRIELEFYKARNTPSDINEHMDRLLELARECDVIVEGGVRYVTSSWAFLYGCACRGGEVHSYCWNLIPEIQRALDICKEEGVPWHYYDGDWLLREVPECDMIFFDTNHFASQLREELRLHAPKAKKYLAFHDTTTFGEVGADGLCPGLWQPILDFMEANPKWKLLERRTNNNGLTVCKRIAT